MSSPVSEAPSAYDAVKFLLERSHVEAQLFWQRNNFMFLANTAFIGTVFLKFYLDSDVKAEAANAIRPLIASAGLFLTLIWGLFNKVGRRMNHVYLADAKRLAQDDQAIRAIFQHSLGNNSPSESVTTAGEPLVPKIQASGWSATMLNYIFILGFAVAWIYVFCKPILP
ncbi:RipA family octameric membrane protein [Hydrogenophaga sp.]|uniref:RipA family octameric membrane protein n=1 Tax=Hydrogenophaga sp. TaxID=1904254 RepID=UPI003F709B75